MRAGSARGVGRDVRPTTAITVCPCVQPIKAENLIAAGISPLWCRTVDKRTYNDFVAPRLERYGELGGDLAVLKAPPHKALHLPVLARVHHVPIEILRGYIFYRLALSTI